MTQGVDADVQAAVDATAIAHRQGEEDLVEVLRLRLAEREIEDPSEAWLERTVEGIRTSENYMAEGDPRA